MVKRQNQQENSRVKRKKKEGRHYFEFKRLMYSKIRMDSASANRTTDTTFWVKSKATTTKKKSPTLTKQLRAVTKGNRGEKEPLPVKRRNGWKAL